MSKVVFIKFDACAECCGAGTVINYDGSNGQVVVGRKECCRLCCGLGVIRKRMSKEQVLEAVERMESPR